MHKISLAIAVLALSFVGIGAPAARAQNVGTQLATLLTEQTPAPAGYVRDLAAANATFGTVASLFLVELTALPVASSSGGFVYRFNPTLGTAERASDNFGPFFTERSLRNGRNQFSVGFSYQFANFETLQGADLTTGTFPTNNARFVGAVDPFSVDTLSLDLEMRTFTGVASYGVTDDLDIGVVVPITRLQFSGQRVNIFQGQSTLQSSQTGSATGLGDVALNVRYSLKDDPANGYAVGSDLRLPTGREEDLLGAGKAAWRLMGIGSWEIDRMAMHINAGFGLGGVSREVFWSWATTVAVTPRFSAIGEVMGRRLSNLNTVADVYQPHPVLAGVETMRWLPDEDGVQTAFIVTGFKWNVGGNWLLNANLVTRLSDAGLRARFTPSIAIDRAIEF